MECDPLINNSKRCRVCLEYTDHTVCLLDVSSTKREPVSYLEILSSICKLESENGPQEICMNCAQNAEVSYDFKVLCEQSDKVLKHENELNGIGDIKIIPELVSTNGHFDEHHDYFDTDDDQSEMIDVKDVNIDFTPVHSFNDAKLNEEDIKNVIKINELEDKKETTSITNEDSQVKIQKNSSITCSTCNKTIKHKKNFNKHQKNCTKLMEMNEKNIKINCPLCEKSFAQKHLQQHISKCSKKHTPEKLEKISNTSYNSNCESRDYPETCQFCNYKPVSRNDYHKHKNNEHFQKKPQFCSYCDYRFINADDYRKHLTLEHSDKKIDCKHCDCPLYTIRSYSQHMKNTHPNEKLVCHLCNFTADMSGILYMHYQDDHSDHFHARQCNFCDFKTNNTAILGKHMEKVHDDKKTIQCEKCDKKFFTFRQKQAHGKSQHEKLQSTVICEICGKNLKNPANLRTHMYIHQDEGKYQCKLCPKSFRTSSCLYLHTFSHSEERIHKCNDCEMLFKTTPQLNTHIKRVHLKIKPVNCDECGRKFMSRSQMLKHAVIHTGIKNYECTECGKLFSTKKNLVQHSVVHTGERKHMCEVCGKGFTQAHVLRSHLKVHNLNK